MNFNYINSFFLFFIFIFSCSSIENFYNNEDIEYQNNNEEIENIDKIDLSLNSNDKSSSLDFYNDNLFEYSLEDINPRNKILIKNFQFDKHDTYPLKLIVYNKKIYGVDSNLNFNSYDYISGKLINSINLLDYDIDISIPTSFSFYKDQFIIGFKSGKVIMISHEGNIIWSVKYNGILSTPIKIINNEIILLFENSIKSINPNNGEENWTSNYDSSRLLHSKGGSILQFANLIFYILPNSTVGEYDTLLGEKNVTEFSSLNFDPIKNYNYKIHLYKNFISFFDGRNKLSVYDLYDDKWFLNDFKIDNSSSYAFFNNSFIIKNKNIIKSYNIKNGNLFWVLDIEDIISEKADIILIKSHLNLIHIYFSNGKILIIKNKKVINDYDLKIKDIKFIYFHQDKLFTSLKSGKTAIFSK